MNPMKREAAGLIREHLWQPHAPNDGDGTPMTMARELDIWEHITAYLDPEALNGAIALIRGITGAKHPMSLSFFLQRPHLLTWAVAEYHKSLSGSVPRGPQRGDGLVRLAIDLSSPDAEVD